jgi:hypothetical protein
VNRLVIAGLIPPAVEVRCPRVASLAILGKNGRPPVWESLWMSRSKLILSALIICLAFIAAVLFQTRPWESAADRAHGLCDECGLSADEIDALINTMRGMDRAVALDLSYAAFDHPRDAEPCEPLRQRDSRRG